MRLPRVAGTALHPVLCYSLSSSQYLLACRRPRGYRYCTSSSRHHSSAKQHQSPIPNPQSSRRQNVRRGDSYHSVYGVLWEPNVRWRAARILIPGTSAGILLHPAQRRRTTAGSGCHRDLPNQACGGTPYSDSTQSRLAMQHM
jgi:hypothetical protein